MFNISKCATLFPTQTLQVTLLQEIASFFFNAIYNYTSSYLQNQKTFLYKPRRVSKAAFYCCTSIPQPTFIQQSL